MTENMVMFLVAQGLVILAGVLGSHISTRTQIAELRGMLTQSLIQVEGLKTDHANLGEKVDGISRHVAHIEGMEEARGRFCRAIRKQQEG
jgi:hypothetical protein